MTSLARRRRLLAVLVASLAALAVWLVPVPVHHRSAVVASAQPAVRVQVAVAPAVVRAGRPGHGERSTGWAGGFALAASSIFAVALLAAGRAYANGRIGRGFGRGLRPTSRGPPLHLAG
ncbi:MAG: hypothetical protein QOF60_2482 [Actinomycetota bacterium]|jgi:hypothetical protein|nr:hypothetical protein [Actinomycetota bacterium]